MFHYIKKSKNIAFDIIIFYDHIYDNNSIFMFDIKTRLFSIQRLFEKSILDFLSL